MTEVRAKRAPKLDATDDEDLSRTINDLSLKGGHKTKLIQLPEAMLPYRPTICAYVASSLSQTAGYPFDSVKTRQQTYKYKSSIQCILDTYKTEGVSGFYRGLAVPLLTSSMTRSLCMTAYSFTLPHWSKIFFSIYTPPSDKDSLPLHLAKTFPVTFVAGSTAGVVGSIIGTPFEYVKLVAQIERITHRYHGKGIETDSVGMIPAAKHIFKYKGVLGFYPGIQFAIVRDLIGSGIYFTTYDILKTTISRYTQHLGSSAANSGAIALAGASAGVACWLVVYPIDTYKSHYQRDTYIKTFYPQRAKDIGGQMGTPLTSFRSLWKLSMYSGIGVSVIRTSLIGTVFFSCYERLIDIC